MANQNRVILVVENSSTFILGTLQSEVYQRLRQETSYRPENAEYMVQNTGGGWDGLIPTICYRKCRCPVPKNGVHFPTGLLGKVRQFFKDEKIPVLIEDKRLAVNPTKNFAIDTGNFELRDYQQKIIEDAAARERGIVKLATGGGKCLRDKDLCLTEDGLLEMREISESLPLGEYVNCQKRLSSPLEEGGVELSSQFYRDGIGKSFKLTTDYKFTLTGTPCHQIKVVSATGDIVWKKLQDLSVGDYCVLTKNQKMFGSVDIDIEDAYWYGLLMGDGGYSQKSYISFTNSDKHLLDFVREYINKKQIKNFHDYDHNISAITRDMRICNVNYRKTLVDLGFEYSNALAKTIPVQVRKSNSKSLAMFLRGLYETDGWVGNEKNKPTICIGLSSQRAIDQLHVVLLNFGIVASRRLKKTTHADSHILAIYREYIPKFIKEIGFDPKGHKFQKLNDAMAACENIKCNTNTDIIPHQQKNLNKLRDLIKKAYGFYGTKKLVEESGVKFTTLRSWSDKCAWRNPSRGELRKFLLWCQSMFLSCDVGIEISVEANGLINRMLRLTEDDLFYDKVEKIEETISDNYDFVVPKSHSFVAQGFINHNTAVASGLIAKLNIHPFIFYVPSVDLLRQSKNELSKFIFENNKNLEVGEIGGGVCDIKDINVMTVQTAVRALGGKYKKSDEDDSDVKDSKEVQSHYREIKNLIMSAKGMIADEVQHWAAETCQIISDYSVACRYKYGFSATPWRDKGDDILIDSCFGKLIADINASFLIKKGFLVKPTIYFVPVNNWRGTKGFTYAELYKSAIVENTLRNTWIANIANNFYAEGRNVLVLVRQINHGNLLQEMIPGSVFLHGSCTKKERENHLAAVRRGEARLTIGSTIADEGIDCKPWDTLIQAGSGKSQTRALQRIGRILRPSISPITGKDKPNAVVVDFMDNCKWMLAHSRKRKQIYQTEEEFIIDDLVLEG